MASLFRKDLFFSCEPIFPPCWATLILKEELQSHEHRASLRLIHPVSRQTIRNLVLADFCAAAASLLPE